MEIIPAILFSNNLSNGNNKFFTVQTDYTNPISEKTKLEAGLRAQMNEIENNNETYCRVRTEDLQKFRVLPIIIRIQIMYMLLMQQ